MLSRSKHTHQYGVPGSRRTGCLGAGRNEAVWTERISIVTRNPDDHIKRAIQYRASKVLSTTKYIRINPDEMTGQDSRVGLSQIMEGLSQPNAHWQSLPE